MDPCKIFIPILVTLLVESILVKKRSEAVDIIIDQH